MSIKLMSVVWGMDLPQSEKFVLLALADNANDEGACWPSVTTLSKKTSLSDRAVRDIIRRLERAGHMAIESRSGSSNYFRLTPAATAPLQDMHPTPAAPAPPPCSNCIPPLQEVQEAPAAAAARTIIEPSMNRKSESKRKRQGVVCASDEVMAIIDCWKAEWNHPRAALDANRKKVIERALEHYSVTDLTTCIKGYRNSPFHTGVNATNTVYGDIETMLRNAKQIDAGLRFYENPPNLRSEKSEKNLRVLKDWRPPEFDDETAGLSEIPSNDGGARGSIQQGREQRDVIPLLGRTKAVGH